MNKITKKFLNVGQILKINKGLGTDFNSLSKIDTAIKELGLGGTPNPESPFKDLSIKIAEKSKTTGENIGHYKTIKGEVKKFFIEYSDAFDQFGEELDYFYYSNSEEANKIKSKFKTFLGVKYLEKIKGGTFHNDTSLLLSVDENSIISKFNKLSSNADFRDNYLIRDLKKTIKGEKSPINKLEFNNRVKIGDRQANRYANAFKELRNNPEYSEFSKDLLRYLIVKDGFQFKKGSFIKYVDPIMFDGLSKGFNALQEELNSPNPSLTKSLGASLETLKKEFTEKYVRTSWNSGNVKGLDYDTLVESNIEITSDIRNTKTGKLEEIPYVKLVSADKFRVTIDPAKVDLENLKALKMKSVKGKPVPIFKPFYSIKGKSPAGKPFTVLFKLGTFGENKGVFAAEYKPVSKIDITNYITGYSSTIEQLVKLDDYNKKTIQVSKKSNIQATAEKGVTEVAPGIKINNNAISKNEEMEIFEMVRPLLESQASRTNKSKSAPLMIGLGLRWDYTSNNKGKTPVKIETTINNSPSQRNKYAYYDKAINGQSLGEIPIRLKELVSKATGVDSTDYDGAIVNVYQKDSFISAHNDVDESITASKYPVLVVNLGGEGSLSVEGSESQKAGKGYSSKKYLNTPLSSGGSYIFGEGGKNREVFHRTLPSKGEGTLPSLTLQDGTVISTNSYRITITLRRVQDLEKEMPKTPKKVSIISNSEESLVSSTSVEQESTSMKTTDKTPLTSEINKTSEAISAISFLSDSTVEEYIEERSLGETLKDSPSEDTKRKIDETTKGKRC